MGAKSSTRVWSLAVRVTVGEKLRWPRGTGKRRPEILGRAGRSRAGRSRGRQKSGLIGINRCAGRDR